MMPRSLFAAFLSVFGLGGPAVSTAAAPDAAAAEKQAVADKSLDYMGEIARAIVDSDEMQGREWGEVSLVIGFDEDGRINENYGYAYDDNGAYTAIALDFDLLEKPAEAYHNWLRRLREGKIVEPEPVNDGIIKMLFQLNRRNNKVNADFEYDNTGRWKVTPDNLDTMIEELRPRL